MKGKIYNTPFFRITDKGDSGLEFMPVDGVLIPWRYAAWLRDRLTELIDERNSFNSETPVQFSEHWEDLESDS